MWLERHDFWMNPRVIRVSPSFMNTATMSLSETEAPTKSIGMAFKEFARENKIIVFLVLILLEVSLLGGSIYLANSLKG